MIYIERITKEDEEMDVGMIIKNDMLLGKYINIITGKTYRLMPKMKVTF